MKIIPFAQERAVLYLVFIRDDNPNISKKGDLMTRTRAQSEAWLLMVFSGFSLNPPATLMSRRPAFFRQDRPPPTGGLAGSFRRGTEWDRASRRPWCVREGEWPVRAVFISFLFPIFFFYFLPQTNPCG